MLPSRSPTTPQNGQQQQPPSGPPASPTNGRTSTSPINPVFLTGTSTPMRFATSTNAFGLNVSPTSSSSSRDGSGGPATNANSGPGPSFQPLETGRSPPSAGTVTTKRLRRPSMLSLAQTASFSSDKSTNDQERPSSPSMISRPMIQISDPSSSTAVQGQSQIVQPSPFLLSKHRSMPFSGSIPGLQRTSSAPSLGLEGLKASTPPLGQSTSMELEGSGSESPMDTEGDGGNSEADNDSRSPLRWAPSHLQTSASRRKGKGKMDDLDMPTASPIAGSSIAPISQLHAPPFTGRPLPASLLATLISESTPLKHEMESEARLQRFISSHPSALPLTPRAPRSSRGRFPEMVGGEDDDDQDDIRRKSGWAMRSWMGGGRGGSTSDSDSDDMLGDDAIPDTEPVNAAFAAGMDMDRPTSSSSSSRWAGGTFPESGKALQSTLGFTGSTNQPTPPSNNAPWSNAKQSGGRLSSSAAGSGMVPSPGTGFALPNAFGSLGMGGNGGTTPLASPTIERLELAGSPSAAMSSPGLMQYRDPGSSAGLRPGKRKAQEDRYDPYKRPRGSSPSFSTHPMSPSRSSAAIPIPQSPGHSSLFASNYQLSTSNPSRRPGHLYTRPMASRSRAASPALSIGSTSGVLSTSLGNGQKGFGLGGAFVPSNQGALAQQGAGQNALGGLGLLSLANVGEVEEGEEADEDDPGHMANEQVGSMQYGGERGRRQSNEDEREEAMEED